MLQINHLLGLNHICIRVVFIDVFVVMGYHAAVIGAFIAHTDSGRFCTLVGIIAGTVDIRVLVQLHIIVEKRHAFRFAFGRFRFIIELEGDIAGENGKEMLKELEGCCDKLKITGSFKKES